ncbi:flagellar basal body L-ring protein FlgH [Stutzerimonas urumqiensis]|uniref:flagellar basal body L-ring protein FlgH n=1 Tax=Stutzerimonas urumqiensis TaxID=638269 RepID=UPI000EB55BE0|nr:flagellar basal body L-ring protein FlgH [Stutzerimonas urumqiensis]
MRQLLACGLLALLTGCASFDELRPEESSTLFEPPVPAYPAPVNTAGGLFGSGHVSSLTSDRRAVRVGDILTIVLDESTQSSKSAGTSFGKSSSIGLATPNVLGKTYPQLDTAVSGEREFEGAAESSQQNTLRGSIAVTVHQVLPSGVLVVKGEKALRLNQGDEYIRLSGLVRREDINRFNQVSSQNIANARIAYSGRGVLNDSNRAGWLTRFFTSPLFPL